MKGKQRNIQIDHLLEKGSGPFNEDRLVIEKNLFGVFDGASSLEKRFFEGNKTGGMIAADTAAQIFSQNHYPLEKLSAQANQAIFSKMVRNKINLSRRHCLWCTSAAVARIKKDTLEWIQTGDAHILLFYGNGTHRVLVDREDHDFKTLSMLRENGFVKNHAFSRQIRKTREEMNRTYGVFNGEPEALGFLKKGSEPLKNVEAVLLFTDGLQLPGKQPSKKPRFNRLARLYRQLGLCGLKNHIRKVEAKDPDVERYPRFKRHDDIAAIAVHL